MICQCGTPLSGVSVIRGVVKISTCKCPCGRVHRKMELTGPYDLERIRAEISRIKERHPCYCSPHIHSVVNFLTIKAAFLEVESVRGRQSALWEREFLKRTIGDDY